MNEENEYDEVEPINPEGDTGPNYYPDPDLDADRLTTNNILPPGWENAPPAAMAAFFACDGDDDLFDQIKAELKGE